MFGKFLPRSTDFFEYFDKHINVTIQGAHSLLKMISQEHSEQVNISKSITNFEKQADIITRECIEALHKTFITPFDRNDIYALITRMDDIMDSIEDISTRIIIYKLDTRTREIDNLVRILNSSVQNIQIVLTNLHQNKPQSTIHSTLMNIHKLENDADDVVLFEIGKLFDEEKDPFLLIKWKEIYEHLEDTVDCCESVANIIEGVIIEST